jgi:membrane fusion protein (multidrug efflux system)
MDSKGSRPRRSKRLLVTLTAVALTLGAAAFFGLRTTPVSEAQAAEKDADKKKEKEPTLVAVAAVAQGAISAYVTATANLVSEDEVKVLAEAEGQVVGLGVEEGDDVRAGELLLQIDPRDAKLAVEKAELALRNAQLSLDRSQQMAAERLISAQELDRVRFERDLKAHELSEARRRLDKTAVRAPFAGRITLRSVQLGQNVKPADALFSLASFDPLVARIFLPEREMLGLQVGQRAQLSLKADDSVRFEGRIRQIAPVVDTGSGTVKVTVEAVRPPSSVRPGAFVGVGIVNETRQDALLIPRPAVIREIQETYVYVADGTVARKRPVKLGLEEGDRFEVTEGLSVGDLVVTSGQGALKDAAPIKLPAKKAEAGPKTAARG